MKDVKKFDSLYQLQTYFKDEKTCKEWLIRSRWQSGSDLDVVCPYCGKHHCRMTKSGRFACSSCGNKFSERVGTIFQDTKLPLRKWIMAIYLISSSSKGISSCQLSKHIHVTQKSAWYMLMKVRTMMYQPQVEMTGDIECDEVYIGGSEKWKHWDKKTLHTAGRSVATKTPVFGMVQRGSDKYPSYVCSFVVNQVDKYSLYPIIRHFVSPSSGSRIFTDESNIYKGLRKNHYRHFVINHKACQFSYDTCDPVLGTPMTITTNNIEGFWAHLKGMIRGIYHQTSPKHLQHYLDEECFRFNHRKHKGSANFNTILKRSLLTPVPYRMVS